jgi:hypothetical protein
MEDLDVLVLFNNHPYAKFPEARDQETAEFRRRIVEERIEELAYATYPEEVESAGYTYALILNASSDRMLWVSDTMREIVGESLHRMF